MATVDIEDIGSVSEIDQIPKPLKGVGDIPKLKNVVKDFIAIDNHQPILTEEKTFSFLKMVGKKYKFTPSKNQIVYAYRVMLAGGEITEHPNLIKQFRARKVRGTSGVTVFTQVMTPYPETGIMIPRFEKNKDYNSFWVKDKEFSDTGLEVHIDPNTGKIISQEPFTVRYIKNIIKERIDYKEKELKEGNEIVDLLNPHTGELRQSFSCPFNCYFCPDQTPERGAKVRMPRSYIDDEPAVARSHRNGWDPVRAIRDRYKSYRVNGHDVDKLEYIIEGGTYTCYPSEFRRRYMRDLFYAANTLDQPFDKLRERLSLEEEQRINETADYKVIGITIETRPDYIKNEDLVEFRECGITRVQLGVQHTDDQILKKINRQCTTAQVKTCIKKLKEAGYKIDIHLMPDLPGSNFEKDVAMLYETFSDPDLQIDQIKFYPTIIVKYTVIKEWYDKGRYKPYAEVDKGKQLIELCVIFKSLLKHYHRTNRVQRDIPDHYIEGGSNKSNLGQIITNELKARGMSCKCIRCREIRDNNYNPDDVQFFIRKHEASGGTEFFLSFETKDEKHILGFLRLRLSKDSGAGVFEEIQDCAMIRELHVYGQMSNVGETKEGTTQHQGYGTKLLEMADEISKAYGYKKISVISGVGVKPYYRKRGFDDGKFFLIKELI